MSTFRRIEQSKHVWDAARAATSEPVKSVTIGDEEIPVERCPSEASVMFGERIELAHVYANALARDGERLGLLGPLEYPRLWSRHIINCGLIAHLVSGSVADVGSGAGLPGIPVALVRPSVRFTLIEPMERRSKWLEERVNELGLSNVTVIRARAEELFETHEFDSVIARAVAALPKLIPLTAPLVRNDGELLLIKGQSAQSEIERAATQIRRFHLENVRVEVVGEDADTESTRVVRATVRRR